jgi:hypothetical protein
MTREDRSAPVQVYSFNVHREIQDCRVNTVMCPEYHPCFLFCHGTVNQQEVACPKVEFFS